ncbi:MAG: CCA tRNA nucleotidyltransferase [Bacteroidia bacterium]|nr:CCA tRNA nucleotidyltransferase [Bacteroidia bacterium]
MDFEFLKQPIFQLLQQSFDELNTEAFLIGGFVRDYLLYHRVGDEVDIVCTHSALEAAELICKKLGDHAKLSVFKNFGTAHIAYQNKTIELVNARKESYRKDSRKPQVEMGTLEDDQKRRDFTINALAIGLDRKNFGKFLDPFNGVEDLKNKIIRTPLDPVVTFDDDPLRMMRAIRFAAKLQFTIEPKTFHAIQQQKERIKIVSKERIADELNKIILTEKPSVGLKLLDESGLLEIIFPELSKLKGTETINGLSHKDNFLHTLQVLDNVAKKSDNLWLRWAALLHDIAKPVTKKFEEGKGFTFHGHEEMGARMVPKIFAKLKLPLNEKMKYVQKLVRLHLRPIVLAKTEVTDSAVRRVLFEASDDIEDLMILCEADITTKNPLKVKRYLQNFELVRKKLKEIEEKDHIRNFQPIIRGEEIIQMFHLKPGKMVGILKDALKEAILEGIIQNEYEQAKNFLVELYNKIKDNPESTIQKKDNH